MQFAAKTSCPYNEMVVTVEVIVSLHRMKSSLSWKLNKMPQDVHVHWDWASRSTFPETTLAPLQLLRLRRIIIHYRDGISLIEILSERYREITCKVLPVGLSYCDRGLIFFLMGGRERWVVTKKHACLRGVPCPSRLSSGCQTVTTLSFPSLVHILNALTRETVSTYFYRLMCLSSVTQLCLTLCVPLDRSPARLLCPWDFSRQEYCKGLPRPPPGASFPMTQGSNSRLLHRQVGPLPLSLQGNLVQRGRISNWP